jgi:hypothetical protein
MYMNMQMRRYLSDVVASCLKLLPSDEQLLLKRSHLSLQLQPHLTQLSLLLLQLTGAALKLTIHHLQLLLGLILNTLETVLKLLLLQR